mmetsp:Transcript_11687/g.23498  ORF Transcript_11687/g.23498 Transcript_11687/m.23498 type:complete len:903 (+) Transcript_11687:88-2796(+)
MYIIYIYICILYVKVSDNCADLADATIRMNAVLDDMGYVNASKFDVSESIFLSFERALEAGAHGQVLYSARLCLLVLKDVPRTFTRLDQCETDTGINTTASGIVTLRDLYTAGWTQLNSAIQRALFASGNTNGTNTGLIAQTVTNLANSSNGAANTSVLISLVNILNNTLANTPTDILTNNNGTVGDEVGDAIGDLLGTALDNNNSTDNTTCIAVNEMLLLMEQLMSKVAGSLVPSDAPYATDSRAMTSLTKTEFTDAGLEAESPKIRASIRTRATNDTTRRNTGTLTLTSILRDLGSCRQLPPGYSLGSSISSVTITGGQASRVSLSFPQLTEYSGSAATECSRGSSSRSVLECQWWSEANSTWSTEGCEMVDSDNETLCVCNHLTEFAILQRQVDCEAEPPLAASVIYIGLTVFYGILFVLVCGTGYKIRDSVKTGAFYEKVKTFCISQQTLFRIPLCLLLSGQVAGFHARTLNLGVVLFFFSMPHTFLWGSFVITVYQWAVINHHSRVNKLAKKMFDRFIYVVVAIMMALVACIWTSFAIFLYFIDRPERTVGPVMMCFISTVVAVSIFIVGRQTLKLIDTLHQSMAQRKVTHITFFVFTLGSLLLLQALIWIIASAAPVDEGGFLSIMVVFYLADIFMVLLQIDFILGMRVIKSVLGLRSSIFTAISGSSRNHSPVSSVNRQRPLQKKRRSHNFHSSRNLRKKGPRTPQSTTRNVHVHAPEMSESYSLNQSLQSIPRNHKYKSSNLSSVKMSSIKGSQNNPYNSKATPQEGKGLMRIDENFGSQRDTIHPSLKRFDLQTSLSEDQNDTEDGSSRLDLRNSLSPRALTMEPTRSSLRSTKHDELIAADVNSDHPFVVPDEESKPVTSKKSSLGSFVLPDKMVAKMCESRLAVGYLAGAH